MKYKKNTRMCTVCRERKEKDDFFRIAKTKDGAKARIDVLGTIQGRGAYLCKTESCIAAAKKRKALSRSLNCAVDDELFEEMMELLKDK